MNQAEWEKASEHRVEAFYSNLPVPGTCVLGCSCGVSGIGKSWEEAGIVMDEHVAEVRKAGRRLDEA